MLQVHKSMNSEPNAKLAERTSLYRDMAALSLTPLWEVLHALVPQQPATPCVPAHWPYEKVRPFIERAGRAITAEEAVRRVLILENPALRGQSSVTQSLYAGLQLILPGEIAPAHRHTQSALRFVIEGSGAFTAVEGQRTTMSPGDFIITPSWAWHDHGSEADNPVVWLDGLDIPIVRFFDTGFAETSEVKTQEVQRPEGLNFAQFGFNLAPISQDKPFGATSPIFSYPYLRTREALDQLERFEAIDPHDGVKLRYINPQTGSWPMPTIATFAQRLPPRFSGRRIRQTDGAVYSVVEGQGQVEITPPGSHSSNDSITFEFSARDHFVIPSWHTARFASETGCVLFSFSDRPVHQALSIHREERL